MITRTAYRLTGALALLAACAVLAGCSSRSSSSAPSYDEKGEASYYAHKFHGRTTANGETYDMYKMTAAHRTLPFGTRVRVTNLSNGRKVDLKINDRGPFVDGRIIDVSYAAARKLDMIQSGVVPVRVESLD